MGPDFGFSLKISGLPFESVIFSSSRRAQTLRGTVPVRPLSERFRVVKAVSLAQSA